MIRKCSLKGQVSLSILHVKLQKLVHILTRHLYEFREIMQNTRILS